MSHFSFAIDGSIVGLYLLVTMVAGIFVRKYVGKVEHFLVAGREMNVFLGIASLAATEFGIVTCMYSAQLGYDYGFAGATPGICQAVAMLVIGVTGFCIKPLRDSGVITIPELLEKRFGPRVRWAAGVVIILGGLLNMGIFLRVGGNFLVEVSGLDTKTFPLEWMMTALLVMVAVYTILGGMLSVLVTDFLQFVVMSVGLITVTALILYQIGWDKLAETVSSSLVWERVTDADTGVAIDRSEKLGTGGFNPFVNPKLGWSWVVFQILIQTAATLTWQTTIARVLAAKDTATGRKIYTRTSFFFVCGFLLPAIWGIAALVDFPRLPESSPDWSKDYSMHMMPAFLSHFLPVGLMGLLLAAMLAAEMSTDSSYMLTWASVIYNDLLAPFHRHRWSEKTGLLWNRCIVAAIGVFLMFYGLWYPLEGNVWQYLAITGSIYLSSMSMLLIACCYLKWANNWGAIGSIIFGALFPASYLVLQQVPATKEFAGSIGDNYAGIASYVAAALAMVVGSVLKNQIRPTSASPTMHEVLP
ncbi:MAG: sodium:solute symporter family protein [Planctomycetaceae bacterium]